MNANRSVPVILLGFTVDDDVAAALSQRSAVLAVQTHNFAKNLVRALTSTGVPVKLISVLPIPNYPEYPKILIHSGAVHQGGAAGISLGFVNLMLLKHLTRFFACITRGRRYVGRVNPKVVIVHGVHSPFLLFASVLQKSLSTRTCLIMTDPPGVVREIDGVVSRALKRIDRVIVTRLASRFDGVIALTPQLARDFAPGVPALVMEGFADAGLALPSPLQRSRGREQRVSYAGGISEDYGVRNLVLAFMQIEDAKLRLDLFGRGPLEPWVQQKCRDDRRIRYHGALPHDQVIGELRRSQILVNARPAHQSFVQYSFPSKLLEYMALGVPVVTTRLAGIPRDYYPYLELVDDDSVDALTRAILAVRTAPVDCAHRARLAQEYVLAKKSITAQGERIERFLSQIAGVDLRDTA